MSGDIKHINLATISKTEMLPKTFYDHNHVNLADKRKPSSFKWKLNISYYRKN